MMPRAERQSPAHWADTVQVEFLGNGRHVHPRKGGCLMELVSATVGGPWSDQPICTPPILAHLARTINDHTSRAGRPRLARLIPYLVTHLDRDGELGADLAVATAVLAAAKPVVPAELVDDLARQLLQHAERAADCPPGGYTSRRHRRRMLAVTDVTLRTIYDSVGAGHRDNRLRDLLIASVNAERAHEGVPPITRDAGWDTVTPGSVTVLASLVTPPGADWLEVEAHLDGRYAPDWLSEAWQQRQAELHHLQASPS